jgi:hypothetical protein
MDLREIGRMVWIGFIWLRIGPAADSCEYGNKTSGSIKGWEILDWLSDY